MSSVIKQIKKVDKKYVFSLIVFSVFFSLNITAFIYKMKTPLNVMAPLKLFKDRVMGNSGFQSNSDIAIKLQYYFIWFVLIVLIAAFVFLLFSYSLGRFSQTNGSQLKEEMELLSELSLTGFVLFAYYLFSSNYSVSLLFLWFAVFSLIFFSVVKLIWLHNLRFSIFRLFIVLILPAFLFVYPSVKLNNSGTVSKKKLFLILFFAALLFIIMQFLIKKWLFRKTEYEAFAVVLMLSSIPILATGVVQSILLELRNIFEKRGLPYTTHPFFMYVIVMGSALICAAVILLYFRKRPGSAASFTADSILQKFHYPLILLTAAFVIAQPYAATSPWSEFFETANHGLAWDAFFRYGSLPIIQNFDAHMLSNELPGFLYYLLNGYEPWAFVLYSGFYIIPFVFICYYFLKNIIAPRQALLLTLFFPCLFQIFQERYIFSILLFFVTYRLLNELKTRYYYYFWFIVGFLLLYQLDDGVSALIGGLAALGFGCLAYKIKLSLKKLLVSGILTGAFYGLTYLVLCLAKGVNPVSRLLEFIHLCSSNQNWAYSSQGDLNNIGYSLYYYILPLTVIVLAVVLTVKLTMSETYRNDSKRYAIVGFLYFAGFYLSNLPRGLVRHSLVEETSVLILSTFAIAVLCCLFSKQNSQSFFKAIAACFLLVILSNVAFSDMGTRIFSQSSTIQTAVSKYKGLEPYSATDISHSRVKGAAVSGEAAELKTILDDTLPPDATYFDFSSLNYYYALTGRKNPLYANQSPLMLSGDAGQNDALQELKKNDVVYVLMPKTGASWSNIDGISVCLKYYKLSEYIYDNYTPFISLQNVDLWCLKNQKNSLKAKLGKTETASGQPVDFNRINWSQITPIKCSMEKTSKGIQITPNAADPNLSGLISAIRSLPEFQSEPIQSLHFTVNSSAAQNIQIYYTLSGSEDFSEKNSVIYQEPSGNNESILFNPGKNVDRIRFDMDAPVTITGISVNAGESSYTNSYADSFSRDLGYIPLEWGESDQLNSYNNAKVLDRLPSNSSVPAGGSHVFQLAGDNYKQKPIYLSFAIDSAENGTARVDYGTSTGGIFNKVDSITFSTKAGYHKYMIRVSSYYSWWNNQVNSMTFSDTAGVMVRQAAVKQGD